MQRFKIQRTLRPGCKNALLFVGRYFGHVMTPLTLADLRPMSSRRPAMTPCLVLGKKQMQVKINCVQLLWSVLITFTLHRPYCWCNAAVYDADTDIRSNILLVPSDASWIREYITFATMSNVFVYNPVTSLLHSSPNHECLLDTITFFVSMQS